MQVYTSLQTDSLTMPAPTTQFFTGRMPFLPPNQQRQSAEGNCPSCRCCYTTLYLVKIETLFYGPRVGCIVALMIRSRLCAVSAPYYYCAMSNWTTVLDECVPKYENIDIPAITVETMKFASNGMIDPTHNMINDRVYIFHSTNDTIVPHGYLQPLLSYTLLPFGALVS